MGYRNIYIERKKPPKGLVWRAREIIMGPRLSPEVDDATAEKVADTSRELQTESEEDIIQQLAPSVIPGMNKVPDRRLASSAGHQWTNFAPVPLDPSILTNPLPLSKPKPDKAFGYSEEAFTRNQLATIDLLTNATPDKGLLFPFIDIEFKALAKGGSHIIATNQAANAGAIVGHGLVELTRRASGLDNLDYNEPQFFSLSMDHIYVQINMHWLNVEDEQFRFHVERLSKHFLDDANGLRTVQRAVKNILDWGRDKRLRKIRKLLDVYRDGLEREKADADAKAAVEEAEIVAAAASESALVDTEPRKGQAEKGRKRKSSAIPVTALNGQGKPVRAPPRPKRLQGARAMYDYIPKLEDGQSDIGFKEGETIEFANAKGVDENGWIRGRIKGGDGRWGRMPAEYLVL